MVGWAPVLERHEPLAPEGPPASSSEPVAPIIRRHARGQGPGGVHADAWADSTGSVRPIPGALGTRSSDAWRDAEETPSETQVPRKEASEVEEAVGETTAEAPEPALLPEAAAPVILPLSVLRLRLVNVSQWPMNGDTGMVMPSMAITALAASAACRKCAR